MSDRNGVAQKLASCLFQIGCNEWVSDWTGDSYGSTEVLFCQFQGSSLLFIAIDYVVEMIWWIFSGLSSTNQLKFCHSFFDLNKTVENNKADSKIRNTKGFFLEKLKV